MPKHKGLLIALATLSATAAVSLAQNAYPAAPNDPQYNNAPMQTQPAPIERGTVTPDGLDTYVATLAPGQFVAATNGTASARPAEGVFLRVGQHSAVRAVALENGNTELRVEHGIANISVHHPVDRGQILIDLPGGQATLIKDGFYTFNADTDTIRTLKGEAYAYRGLRAYQEPIKVKENHAFIFNRPDMKPFEFNPFEARADLIPYPGTPSGYTGYGPYGLAYGGYPYPYGYYGYPYGYYDPYFYGYPFFGFYGGWGWGGGWGGRGGWGGGGHGGGRH